ncbi:MAG: acyl carrier protein [Oscillospiraceae bacterium]|nr:acyl carrier protein [Oscillospiraceae bacterium]
MVFDTIREMLADQLEISEDKISMETDILSDLGADSLDVVELIMGIENEYGIVITDEAVHNFRTVGDVVEFIEDYLDK